MTSLDPVRPVRWLPTVLGAVLLCAGFAYIAVGIVGGHEGRRLVVFGLLVAAAGVILMRVGRGATVRWPATILGIILLIGGVLWLAAGAATGLRLGMLVRGGIFLLLGIMLMRLGRGVRSIPFRPAPGGGPEFR